MAKPIKIGELWFREIDGFLFASDTASDHDPDWGEVSTIPVEDFPALKSAFPAATERFRLAATEGATELSGKIHVLVPAICLREDKEGDDVREVASRKRHRPHPKFSHFHVSVVKSA